MMTGLVSEVHRNPDVAGSKVQPHDCVGSARLVTETPVSPMGHMQVKSAQYDSYTVTTQSPARAVRNVSVPGVTLPALGSDSIVAPVPASRRTNRPFGVAPGSMVGTTRSPRPTGWVSMPASPAIGLRHCRAPVVESMA